MRYWRALLKQTARVDAAVKGRGGEPWQALEGLALAIGGTRLATRPLSNMG
jgi:hypothetical protein